MNSETIRLSMLMNCEKSELKPEFGPSGSRVIRAAVALLQESGFSEAGLSRAYAALIRIVEANKEKTDLGQGIVEATLFDEHFPAAALVAVACSIEWGYGQAGGRPVECWYQNADNGGGGYELLAKTLDEHIPGLTPTTFRTPFPLGANARGWISDRLCSVNLMTWLGSEGDAHLARRLDGNIEAHRLKLALEDLGRC